MSRAAQPDGYIDYYNRGWYEFTGTTFEDTKGWQWTSVHDPNELPRVLDSWKRCIATGAPFEIEAPLRRKDGVYRWFLNRATPIRDDTGKLVRWVGINTDIDDQKRAERKLAELRYAAQVELERLQRLFNESPAAVCVLRGEDLRIELVNPHILQLWGKDNTVVGKPLMEAVPGLRGLGFDDKLRGVLETGLPYYGKEIRAQFDTNGDGTLQNVFLDFACVPLHAASGTVEGVSVHAYDVTDKVSARGRMETLREDALRALHWREQLLAIVSHDLRNPLGTVLMGAKQIERLAEDNDVGKRTEKAASTILSAVDRMTRLVTDLLDLAKLESGQSLPVDLDTTEVVELTRQAVEQIEPLASARGLTLRMDLTGPLFARCDSDRVLQVLSNLLGNAIKFTCEGGTIHVTAARAGREVLLAVDGRQLVLQADDNYFCRFVAVLTARARLPPEPPGRVPDSRSPDGHGRAGQVAEKENGRGKDHSDGRSGRRNERAQRAHLETGSAAQ